MFPSIFTIGPFTLYTVNVFLFLGSIGAAFLFWQRAHSEHYEDDEVFDILVMAGIFGFIFARVMYLIFHMQELGTNLSNWVSLNAFPGYNELFGVLGGLFYLWYSAKKKKWDAYEITDFAGVGLSFFFIFAWVGRFFAGSYLGDVTTLPIGVNFPNVFDSRHPSQLYFAICFLLLYLFLLWLEKRYRFFEWYRGGKSAAHAGFVTAVFLISYATIHFFLSMTHVQQLVFFGVRLDLFFYIVLWFIGVALLFTRSGLSFGSKKKWAKTPTAPATQSRVGGWLKRGK